MKGSGVAPVTVAVLIALCKASVACAAGDAIAWRSTRYLDSAL